MNFYRVFGMKTGASSTGGKRFAVVDADDSSDLQALARDSGAPITAFVTARESSVIRVRFFNKNGDEKLESDSGALAVAHHVGTTSSCNVVSPAGSLEVRFEDGLYWTNQDDHHVWPLKLEVDAWLEALNAGRNDLDPKLDALCAGTQAKHNVVVPVTEFALNRVKPRFESLAQTCLEAGVNGVILACLTSSRADLEFRFFAPHKGVQEDNAGSFTLASLCGYEAAHVSSGALDLTAAQGYATGKPSSLRARFQVQNNVALEVRVGGTVEEAS
jgi:PhzF family phenazine biosynthesis protein